MLISNKKNKRNAKISDGEGKYTSITNLKRTFYLQQLISEPNG